MLKFGKYKNIKISDFTSREMTNYLYWLRNSVFWRKVDKETQNKINKFLNINV